MIARQVAPNLALDALVTERRARGEAVIHLGFGESRLPVFPPLLEQLAAGAGRNGYGRVAGDLPAREAVAGYLDRRRIPTDPAQVVLAPGSKPLLMALQLAVPGDLLLPAPSWNTYAPQAELAGKAVHRIPIPAECGGVPDPVLLRRTIADARRTGSDPRILLLTLPDNPTGTFAGPGLVAELVEIAREADLLIVSDEIYRDLLHEPDRPFLSPAELAPERTVVTGGLSKNLALGGWRIGFAAFPRHGRFGWLAGQVTAIASEVWSCLAAPMQQVAAYAFAEPPELRAYLAAAARLHGAVAAAVADIFTAAGARCRPPTGGFYVYPDFEVLRGQYGIDDSAGLQQLLLEQAGIAVLGGHHQGDDPAALRFRAATSMLYGDTAEEQSAALNSADPLALPQLAAVLNDLRRSLSKVSG